MNSTRLHVSENASNIGAQIVSKSESLVELLGKVENTNTEIQEAWAGKDATDYSTRLTEQCVEIKKLFETAIATGNALQSAAKAYMDAQSANSTYGA